MSQMLINPTPVPPPNAGSNANPLNQSDAVARPSDSTKSSTENATEQPFAALLKSRMDSKATPTDPTDNAGTPLPTPQAEVGDPTADIDLSTLFPVLAAYPATVQSLEKSPAATKEPGPDEGSLPGFQVVTDQRADQILTALPATPIAALPAGAAAQPQTGAISAASFAALPSAVTATPLTAPRTEPLAVAAMPTEALAATPAAQPATATATQPDISTSAQPATPTAALPTGAAPVMDKAPRKQIVEAKDEKFSSTGSTRSIGTGEAPGKIVPDPAISADADNKTSDKNAPELPANDFRTLMERATATAATTANQASGSTSSPSLRIDTPLGQNGWHDEVGQKLTWMAGNRHQQADLVLNPPQLGRVEVSLTMNGDQATAIFTSSNATVREALEGSMNRLREVLADAGVSLGQTQVGSESPHQSSRKNDEDFGTRESVRYASSIPLPRVEAVARTGVGRSMIDVFA